MEVSKIAEFILLFIYTGIKQRVFQKFLQVHALFTACPGDSGNLGAACTCGVAIRVEDSLYVYRTCREVSYQTVNLLAHHSTIYEVCDDKHMVISTESDGFTKVLLSYSKVYMPVDCYSMYNYIVLVCSCSIGVFNLFNISSL